MTFRFDTYNWLVRLQKGELLVEQLTALIQVQNIESAWISGLGACQWVELGYYDLDKQLYKFKKIQQPLEITNLQGNIAWDGSKPALHIHGSFSDNNMQAYGGHVKELEVGGTCELFLHRWYEGKISRVRDAKVGLKLLDL